MTVARIELQDRVPVAVRDVDEAEADPDALRCAADPHGLGRLVGPVRDERDRRADAVCHPQATLPVGEIDRMVADRDRRAIDGRSAAAAAAGGEQHDGADHDDHRRDREGRDRPRAARPFARRRLTCALLLLPFRLPLGALSVRRLGTLPLCGLGAPPRLLLALSLGVSLGLSLRGFGVLAFSLGPLLLGRALDVGDQLLDAVVERVVGDPQSVECGNLPDALVWPDGALGQFLRARHLGVFHQRNEDPDLTVDRGFDLPPMSVLGVVDAPVALVVGRLQPAAADQQHEHIAGAQRCVDRLLPRPPGLDVVDVPEDGLGPEVEGEAIVDAPSEPLAVVATVGDEDPEWGGGLAHRTATAFSLAQ